MVAPSSPGKMLEEHLLENLRIVELGPAPDSCRQIIQGVDHVGKFVDGMTIDRFLLQARQILLKSRRVYRYGSTTVFEFGRAGDQHLLVLAHKTRAEPGAASLLCNLFGVGVGGEDSGVQSLVPDKLVRALLADQQLQEDFLVIRHYARRPVFDESFNWCGPGWHAEQGILVHGPDITPFIEAFGYAPGSPAIERLPPFCQRMLGEFCWKSNANVANAVGMMLTGLLNNHFVKDRKPIQLLDGNQPNLGKTHLIDAVGLVLDGAEPERIRLTGDDEVEKKLSAALQDPVSSIFFFDNVRGRIDSPLIELNTTSPVLSLRVLGKSVNIVRPNIYLWVVTSNSTIGTSDIVTRSSPIRLHWDGNPREREFKEDLMGYVTRHRLEILGELAGMVLRWKQAGMPLGTQKHRCGRWAQIIGGILHVAGLDEFLANTGEAEAAMDEGMQALSALAEHVIAGKRSQYYVPAGASITKETGRLPKDWVQLFLDTQAYKEKLAEGNPRARATFVGTFLTGKVGRTAAIATEEGTAAATLRKQSVRSDQNRYYFEITQSPVPGSSAPAVAGAPTPPEPLTLIATPAAPPTSTANMSAPLPMSQSGACSAVTSISPPDSAPTATPTSTSGDLSVAAHPPTEGPATTPTCEPARVPSPEPAKGGNDLEWV
jgi:hypothetical protein